MQYTLLKQEWMSYAVRAVGIAAFAAFATKASAGPEQAVGIPAAAICSAATAAATAAKVAVGDHASNVAGSPAAQVQDAPVRVASDFGPAADLGQLEQSRGGTDVHNDMKLDGVVSGNSAINVVTGANSIDTGAFANMSGIPVVIQNSGANVLIQNATIVNLQFK